MSCSSRSLFIDNSKKYFEFVPLLDILFLSFDKEQFVMNKIHTLIIGSTLGVGLILGASSGVYKREVKTNAYASQIQETNQRAELSVLSEYVIAEKFYDFRDNYYLSGDGTNFAYNETGDNRLLLGTVASKIAKVQFTNKNSNNEYNAYFIDPRNYEDFNRYLVRQSGQLSNDVVLSQFGAQQWKITEDSTGYYLTHHDSEYSKDYYLGLSMSLHNQAGAYPTNYSITDYPRVYIYEKSSSNRAYAFVEEFNKRLGTTGTGYSGICDVDGDTDLEALGNAWNGETVGDVKSLKTLFSECRDSLSNSEKTLFDNIFSTATAKASGNILEKALSLYNHLVANRGLEDFLHSISNRDAVLSNSPLISMNNAIFNKTSGVIIIVLSSCAVAILVAALIYRKTKKQ